MAVLVLVAIFAIALPRMRRNAEVRKREHELQNRRERVADEHRTEAAERNRQADMAEQKARMAETEAKRERAEAELREERAKMHEQGMADHELIDESERDKFAGTSAVRDDPAERRTRIARRDGRRAPDARADERLRAGPRRRGARRGPLRPLARERARGRPHYAAGLRLRFCSSAVASSGRSGALTWKPWANSQPSSLR